MHSYGLECNFSVASMVSYNFPLAARALKIKIITMNIAYNTRMLQTECNKKTIPSFEPSFQNINSINYTIFQNRKFNRNGSNYLGFLLKREKKLNLGGN